MKDRWMNIGYEDDELKPYTEPEPDINDPKRIGNCRPLLNRGLHAWLGSEILRVGSLHAFFINHAIGMLLLGATQNPCFISLICSHTEM